MGCLYCVLWGGALLVFMFLHVLRGGNRICARYLCMLCRWSRGNVYTPPFLACEDGHICVGIHAHGTVRHNGICCCVPWSRERFFTPVRCVSWSMHVSMCVRVGECSLALWKDSWRYPPIWPPSQSTTHDLRVMRTTPAERKKRKRMMQSHNHVAARTEWKEKMKKMGTFFLTMIQQLLRLQCPSPPTPPPSLSFPPVSAC